MEEIMWAAIVYGTFMWIRLKNPFLGIAAHLWLLGQAHWFWDQWAPKTVGPGGRDGSSA